MGLKRLIWLFLFCGIALAQQPQSSTAPDYAVNARYVQGVGIGYRPTAGSGLTLNLGKGTANCLGTLVEYAGGTLTLTNGATNYVYLNSASSCAPAFNTSSFASTDRWIAKVTTSGGAITAINDVRTLMVAPGTGATGVPNPGANGIVECTGTACSTSGVIAPSGTKCYPYQGSGGTGCDTPTGTGSTTIAHGTKAMATSSIASGACTSEQTDTATGTATTDTVSASFNADPTSTTGFEASTNGMLAIIVYPKADQVAFKECNNTSSAIVPGSHSLNWIVTR